MKVFKTYIDNFMQEFGFDTLNDFANSSFGHASNKPVIILSISVATIGTFVENFIGLDPFVYLAFILLLVVEFVTGIRASIKEGKKIYSKRFGRVILKIMTYTLIIGIIHVFRTRLPIPSAFGVEINIYSWIYYAAFNLLVIQLILSVFENLSRLGYKETSRLYRVTANFLERYVNLISPEERKEKVKNKREETDEKSPPN